MRNAFPDRAPDVNSTQEGTVGARLIWALFTRHHVPDRERSKIVENILGISYHAAHRRVSGSLPWTIDELVTVAARYGETISEFVALGEPGGAEFATLVVGGIRERCRVWIGEPLPADAHPSLVAVRENDSWVIKPLAGRSSDGAHLVERLLLELPAERRPYRIAVVDDNADITNSFADYLRATGFEAEAFLSFESLVARNKQQPFDGYVIDWLIDGETARNSLAEIRRIDRKSPIVVLTGNARVGGAEVASLASALADYEALLFEKPAQSPIIVAKLSEILRSNSRQL